MLEYAQHTQVVGPEAEQGIVATKPTREATMSFKL